MRSTLLPLAAAALAAAAGVGPAHAQVAVSNFNCATATSPNPNRTPTAHLAWPATDPVWEMDFVRPGAQTTTRGAGLEVRNVYYRGRLIMNRGHVPILNVEYLTGTGCSCYRDWSHDEADMEIGMPNPTGAGACVAVAEAGDVFTTCESNMAGGSGGDPGSFQGVAVEDFGTELVLTSNMTAGWYRYRMKWHFYLDGRIWPEYSFSAASATCTNQSHNHHAYWRFDFDIDGTATNDVVTEVNPATASATTFTNEVQRTWGAAADGVYWQVRDASTDAGYDIVPSSVDRLLPIDPFSKVDAMVVRYVAGNYDDGSPSCAINPSASQLANNETLANQDVVFWYRSSALHPGGDPWECDIVGPMLNPQNLDPTTAEPNAPPAEGLFFESARPNPFNPTTSVRFRVASPQYVSVRLYDVTGREVAVLFDGYARENREEIVRIDGADLPGGTYVVRLEGESVQGSTRVVLLK